jgi:hypothetical protein
MFGGLLGKASGKAAGERGRVVDVGWFLASDQAGFIWEAPQKFARDEPGSAHAKSVR